VPIEALALVLLSAIIHAAWNLLVKSSGDRLLTGWAQLAVGGLVGIPFLVGADLTGLGWFIAASAAVETLYVLALVKAYEVADLSLAYPIARGTAPVLVAAGGALFLADFPPPLAAAGIAVVVAGILVLARHRGPGVGWAVLTGCFISIYTLIDTAAVRRSEDPVGYTVAVFLVGAGLLAPIVAARRWAGIGRRDRVRLLWSWHPLVAGALSLTAYALVLVAVRMAPVGPVAALRETSVVFGALGGWLLLGEPMDRRRPLAAALVAAGGVLIGLS